MGKRIKLTDRQFKERKRSDPEIQRAKISLNAKERASLRARICRIVSKRYREKGNASRAKYVAKTKHGKITPEDETEMVSLCRNATITKLIEFFFDEYLEKGAEGLPVSMSETEDADTDEDYKARVYQAYYDKPANYECLLCVKNHTYSASHASKKKKLSKK